MKTQTSTMVSFSEIHHLARLNWEQDGCPPGLDMEYIWAAESLLIRAKPCQDVSGKKPVGGTTRHGKLGPPHAGKKSVRICPTPPLAAKSLPNQVCSTLEPSKERPLL